MAVPPVEPPDDRGFSTSSSSSNSASPPPRPTSLSGYVHHAPPHLDHAQPWHILPDSLLIELFRFLDAEDLDRVGRVCANWLRVSRDEFLWKDVFCRRWGLNGKTLTSPSSSPSSPSSSLPRLCSQRRKGWREEYIRLDYLAPCVESEAHAGVLADEVLHVCFSPDGQHFATSSKDATVKVWAVGPPAFVRWEYDMAPYHWQYTQFCEFNCSSTMLLVSGVMKGKLVA